MLKLSIMTETINSNMPIDATKAWAKMELNSCYDLPVNSEMLIYDETLAAQITMQGSNLLKMVNNASYIIP